MTAPALSTFANGVGSVSADNLNTMQQTCDTYSDLRAFTGTTGVQVFVRGGSAVADGDQGVFYWSAASTAADNGSTVIAPSGATTGRWLRLAPNQPLVISCTATGTNAITLTPVAGSPAFSAYANYMMFLFAAPNSTSAAVIIGTSIGLLKLFIGGTTGTQAASGTLTQNVLYLIAYNSAFDSGAGGFVIINSSTAATTTPSFSQPIVGGYLDWSVSGNALTIALKAISGNDPSSSEPVYLQFRNATAATGTFTTITVVSAVSVAVSNGSTLGTLANTAFKVWCCPINNAGTVELAVFQSTAYTGSNPYIFPMRDTVIISTTAEGGAGAADSAATFYSTTARATVAMRIAGYAEWSAGLGTAGVWASGPTKVQLFAAGAPLPGDLVQHGIVLDGAVATGTTVLPVDDTIPQNTEGDQYLSQNITPTCAAHLLRVEALVNGAVTAGAGEMSAAVFRDATAGAIAATALANGLNNRTNQVKIEATVVANSVASTTFKVRAGPSTAATMTFNGVSSARLFGGVYGSFIRITEYAT